MEANKWIGRPAGDIALSLSWVPLALAGHFSEGNHRVLGLLVACVMFLSFAHQPLTLPFVYASPWRLSSHRRLFVLSPAVAIVVVSVFATVSPVVVAVVGGMWNAEHTLMQRYGIMRIYGRRLGDSQAKTEKAMVMVWFAVPLLLLIARNDVTSTVNNFGVVTVAGSAVKILAGMSTEATVALPFVALAACYLAARWLVGEVRSGRHNPGKWLYVASTATLFAVALVDPIAGLVGFVGSHSIEYLVIVNRSIAGEARHPGRLGNVARIPGGRTWFFVAYFTLIGISFALLYYVAPSSLLLVVVLSVGALHFFYDSFIWKLRKPEVSASLAGVPPRKVAAA
ncbi:MAG: hypothetical protein ACP5P1_06490 [Acidimicrobiales bacterium]